MPDQREMEEYPRSVVEKLGKDAFELSQPERMIGKRLRDTELKIAGSRAAIQQLSQQIEQGKKRLVKLVEDHAGLVNKAAGITESLIALKFGEAIEEEAERAQLAQKGTSDESQDRTDVRPLDDGDAYHTDSAGAEDCGSRGA